MRDLFSELVIPPAVYREVVVRGATRRGAIEVMSAPWITVQDPANSELVQVLSDQLDRGEAEAIALAVELGGRLPTLLDDRRGRRVALRLGLRVQGSAGILLLAKEQGILPDVRPALDALVEAGLYLSDDVYRRVLTLSGEWMQG